ncbi:MAG: hypothetical protein EBR49_17115, partial [Betaproteobacteria bacterium]|nr:hypothetical protein [Betaproteobacteria bacterium]
MTEAASPPALTALQSPPRHRGRWWADRLAWTVAVLLALAYGLPYSQPVFAALFPALPRPVYLQEPLAGLLWQHLGLVLLSSALAVLVGTAAGLATTQETGR